VGRAPAGAIVSIHYDAQEDVRPGHALVTTTGRTYVVMEVRRQQRRRHRGRWHLRCVVSDEPPPPDTVVHPLFWYRRDRREIAGTQGRARRVDLTD
jgi:hypothetical protein